MKRKIAIAMLCLLASFAAQAQELLVGSYNIRYQNSGDNATPNAWAKRVDVLCELVRTRRPDIFGTQEVLYRQMLDLRERLPRYACIGVGRDDGRREGEHECIFYDKEKIELLDSGHFWLSPTPDVPSVGWDAVLNRMCTWGKFRTRKGRRTVFYFFNLHMDHVGVVARRESARLVVDKIRQLAGDKPVVLTGDFNSDQRSGAYLTFEQSAELADSYLLAESRFAPNGTWNDFKIGRKTDDRIDHVFVSPGISVSTFNVDTSFYWSKDASGAYVPLIPSDHYPLWVRLSLKGGK